MEAMANEFSGPVCRRPILRPGSAEGFAWALVHQARYVVQFGLGDAAQVGALGEELAHFKRQAIDPGDQS